MYYGPCPDLPLDPPEPEWERPQCPACGRFLRRAKHLSEAELNRWCRSCGWPEQDRQATATYRRGQRAAGGGQG